MAQEHLGHEEVGTTFRQRRGGCLAQAVHVNTGSEPNNTGGISDEVWGLAAIAECNNL
jgi:hypothetical protein